MATEPHTHPEQPPAREREVIVTDGGSRSGMSGAIVAVLAVVVIALIAWFAISMLGGTASESGPSIEVPSEINVDTGSGGGS